MTTLLWMLYLAFTLFWTTLVLLTMLHDLFLIQENLKTKDILIWILPIIFTCLLWSIWYFYYLH